MATKKREEHASLKTAHEVFLNLVRAESEKMREVNSFLSEYGLTGPQYNVLRILRGAGKDGLPCGKILERMLTQLPDLTRLVDRLENEGYVTRTRSAGDRRVILIRISAKGLELLQDVDNPILELHAAQFASLTSSELRELGRLLQKARRQ